MDNEQTNTGWRKGNFLFIWCQVEKIFTSGNCRSDDECRFLLLMDRTYCWLMSIEPGATRRSNWNRWSTTSEPKKCRRTRRPMAMRIVRSRRTNGRPVCPSSSGAWNWAAERPWLAVTWENWREMCRKPQRKGSGSGRKRAAKRIESCPSFCCNRCY